MWSKCQAPVLCASLSNNAGGRCLLSASLIKFNSPVRSSGPQSWKRTEKGHEVGWNEIRKGETVPLTPPRRSIDLTNWNGTKGETPDGSPLAWGGVLAGSDRIPSETHCPWGACWCLALFPRLFLTVIYSQHILLVVLIKWHIFTWVSRIARKKTLNKSLGIVFFGFSTWRIGLVHAENDHQKGQKMLQR